MMAKGSRLPTYPMLMKSLWWKIALRGMNFSSVTAETLPGSSAGVVTASLEGMFTKPR